MQEPDPEHGRVLGRYLANQLKLQPPVDVRRLVYRRHGIEVYRWPLHRASGVLLHDGRAWTILVKASDPRTRQRFSIAHEYGHFLLERSRERTFRYEPTAAHAHAMTERRADAFAAELLMPVDYVLSMFQNGTSIDEMAKVFDVSKWAIIRRLEELSLISSDEAYTLKLPYFQWRPGISEWPFDE